MRPYGKVNLVGLLLILGVVGGIYLVVLVAPLYTDNMDVSTEIAAAFNQQTGNEVSLRNFLKQKLRFIGSHTETDDSGVATQVTGLGITDDQIAIDKNETANTLRIQVTYERQVTLKPLNKVLRLHFSPHREGPAPR